MQKRPPEGTVGRFPAALGAVSLRATVGTPAPRSAPKSTHSPCPNRPTLRPNATAKPALIDRFATGANAALQAADDENHSDTTARYLTGLQDFNRLPTRHPNDGKALVLPVVLKHRVG